MQRITLLLLFFSVMYHVNGQVQPYSDLDKDHHNLEWSKPYPELELELPEKITPEADTKMASSMVMPIKPLSGEGVVPIPTRKLDTEGMAPMPGSHLAPHPGLNPILKKEPVEQSE